MRPSRRAVLAGGAALLAAPALGVGVAPLRIGAVLPLGGPALPLGRENLGVAAEAARMGFGLAEEDVGRNAELLGRALEVVYANAPGPEAAARAGRRLLAGGATVLVGGYSEAEAAALSEVAEEGGAAFLNMGATSDALRAACRPGTFHVEASAAMYLDAIAGWFVRAGFRRWHLVASDTPEGAARAGRAAEALSARHWGAEVAGRTVVPLGRDFSGAVAEIRGSEPEIVLVLTDWLSQLDYLAAHHAAGLAAAVTGFPEAMAQTREFYALARQAAPEAGTGQRAALWEATLDAYGARELNARFGARWGRPMDPPAWTAYQAVKIAFEASMRAGAPDGAAIAAALADERAVFDVHKGIGVTFRPGDRQLRQSLYLVRVEPPGAPGHDLRSLLARATLEGEMPAIYMPGTDPVERLDQLGDLGGACA